MPQHIGSRPEDREMSKKAFTMIEIALVLVVVGILAGLLMPVVFTGIEQDKIATGKLGLNDFKEEIIGYAVDNHRLPTTADPVVDRTDVWGAKYQYVPDSNLVGATVDICTLDASALTPLNAATKGGQIVNDLAFLVASPGPDRSADATYAGTSVDMSNSRDDLTGLVTFYELYRRVCEGSGGSSEEENPPEGQISFDQDMPGFFDPVGYTDDNPDADTVVVSQDGLSITLGGGSSGNGIQDGSGCIWYQGTASRLCDAGNCTFKAGLRAYFEFKWNHQGGDGFTFAVISAETNNRSACGGQRTHSQGENLGYAGPGVELDGRGIRRPKMALEFDIYYNGNNANVCGSGSRNDYRYYTGHGFGGQWVEPDHLAFVYWGENSVTCSSSPTWDDNRHAAGSTTPADEAPKNCDGPTGQTDGGYYYQTGQNNDNWLRQGGQGSGGIASARVEIVRNQTADGGNYGYQLKAWYYNRQGSGEFINMSKDYGERAPDLTNTIYLTEGLHNDLDHVLFGWTEGTGYETQLVTLSGFRLSFREPPD